MANVNNIDLAKVYTPLTDELYQKNAVSTVLNSNEGYIRQGANAKEIIYPQVDVTGLGDYDRNSGYTGGAVNVKWVTAAFNYDRGTKLSIDAMDNQETFDIALAQGIKTLEETEVAPEGDAYTFATLAGTTGVTNKEESFADGKEFLSGLIAAKTAMDEAQVPDTERYLFVTPTLYNSVMALDTIKSREILGTFAQIVTVPQTRFYTAIDLLDGRTELEKNGGYKKAEGGKNINFMVVHKPAVIKGDKHVVSSIIAPENNPDADSYIVKLRKYGIVDVLKNKTAGIYVSHAAN